MQSIEDDLTQRVWLCSGGSRFSRPEHVVARIVEKWWRQHMIDYDGGGPQVLSLELQGENLGLPELVVSGYGDVFLHPYLVEGIARICSDCFFRVKT